MDISHMKPWKNPWIILLACIVILAFLYICSIDIEIINAIAIVFIAGYIIYSVNKRNERIKQLEAKVDYLEKQLDAHDK